jgi:hypothetical protein
MKRLHFIFGLTILVVAATLAVVILFKPRERGGSTGSERPSDRIFDGAKEHPRRVGPAAKADPDRPDPLVVGVTAGDPELMETAEDVEAAARSRLVALTEQLALTRDQQARIFPLLARSTPSYDESLEIVGGDGRRGRLSKADAEAGIHEMLDLDQQAELIESIAEKDLWWADLMDRLEEDLVQSTEPADGRPPAAGSVPEGAEEGAVEPTSHRGGNLFDLMNNEER